LKYEFNDAIWNLDDGASPKTLLCSGEQSHFSAESDYTIFSWRRQHQNDHEDLLNKSQSHSVDLDGTTFASSSKMQLPDISVSSQPPPPQHSAPTLHLHDPRKPLPTPPAYLNSAYYMFRPSKAELPSTKRSASRLSAKTSTTRRSKKSEEPDDGIPKFKKEFDRFHSENGVRTVLGQIGPVQNGALCSVSLVNDKMLIVLVRMLLKSGYRHVYISRKFAIKHGFIPPDAAPGNYGYGGLVNIGTYPITLVPSASQPHLNQPAHSLYDGLSVSRVSSSHSSPPRPYQPTKHNASSALSVSSGRPKSTSSHHERRRMEEDNSSPKTVYLQIYLSEEPHFDVVLGRSFFEKRQVKLTTIDPTDVVCLDNGEKIECELVVLKDGRGEIVTVT